MGVYAVTGAASGMGRTATDKLRAAGHAVIGVDVEAADVVADLSVKIFGKAAPSMIYAASTIALSHRVRRRAVLPEWAGAGIRLNALAPGVIMTPLLQRQLSSPTESEAIKSFPVPIGGFGDTSQLGDWVLLMLSDAADFLVGSVVFVDGGSDACFRPVSWPRLVRLRGLTRYVRDKKSFTARRIRHAS